MQVQPWKHIETLIHAALRSTWDRGPDNVSTQARLRELNAWYANVGTKLMNVEVCAGDGDLLVFVQSKVPSLTADKVIDSMPMTVDLAQCAAYIEFTDTEGRVWIVKSRLDEPREQIPESRRNKKDGPPWVFPRRVAI